MLVAVGVDAAADFAGLMATVVGCGFGFARVSGGGDGGGSREICVMQNRPPPIAAVPPMQIVTIFAPASIDSARPAGASWVTVTVSS